MILRIINLLRNPFVQRHSIILKFKWKNSLF